MKTRIASKRHAILLGLVLASLAAACGGSMRQVQGARFELNGQEDTLADEYTQADPLKAAPEARCQYWSGRAEEAGQGRQRQLMGGLVVVNPGAPQVMVTLRAWAQAKQAEVCRGHLKHEQQSDGTMATARISNGAVVATFTAKAKCRDTHVDDRGESFGRQPPWSPCPGSPLAGASVRLIFADGQTVPDTTDTKGLVLFDLSQVRWTDATFKSGHADVALATDPPVASLSLTGLPQYGAWQQKRAEEAKLARDAKALDALEKDLPMVLQLLGELLKVPDPWGPAQAPLTQRIAAINNDAEKSATVVESDRPLDPQSNARYQALLPTVAVITQRTQAAEVHLQRAQAFHDKQQEAAFVAALRGLCAVATNCNGVMSGGGGSTGPNGSGVDDSHLREMDARHQQERADDERRHQQERAGDDRKRQEEKERTRVNCIHHCQEQYPRWGVCSDSSDDCVRQQRDGDVCRRGCPDQ